MSRIRSKDTSPEIIVRSMLHKRGYRFRLHKNSLPGKPDIILPKYKTVIFVHGCFWHIHKNCKRSNVPKSNKEYWIPKLKKYDKYEIYPQTSVEIERVITLCFSEEPSSVLRLFYCIKGTNKVVTSLSIPEYSKFERNGFTVVEWGVILE